jgi:ubiquinone/menaquinone biosynthesis C-methylase UbiE
MTSLFDQTQTSFDDVDSAEQAPAFPAYLTRMAVALQAVKTGLHDLLAPAPGALVLDVGCGTGADVRALAASVGPTGRVVGVDNSTQLVDEARTQSAGQGLDATVGFQVADAHDLPFAEASFDAVRAERVFMHLARPDRALAEMIRVTRPGGRLLVADPDHGMWALDHSDRHLTRTLLAWWFDVIANPWIARGMPARLDAAGLREVRVSLLPIVLHDLQAADAMTGITKAATAAAAQGVITAGQQRAFDAELSDRDRAGRFFMCGTVIAASGLRPERPQP